MLDLVIFTFLFHISGGYEPAPVVWVVAVLVGVWLFVAGPFWFWLVSSHPTLNSFKVTCASRHTQRPYPCKKKSHGIETDHVSLFFLVSLLHDLHELLAARKLAFPFVGFWFLFGLVVGCLFHF